MTLVRGSVPAISLVVTTLGRTAEIEALFRSLAAQTRKDFDVLVVDQNDDDGLTAIIEQDWPFPVDRLATPGERGASRGRNRGWRATRGDLVLFPDDDCWYPPDFLERASARIDRLGCAVLAGRAAEEGTGRSINGRFETTAQPATRANIWTTAIEWMVLFRRSVLEATGGFDEDVGVGASTPWQSCEIQDIILRAIDRGFDCRFDPELVGHHAEIVVNRPDRRARIKARAYARGMGYVLTRFNYPVADRGKWLARPIAGAIASVGRGRWDRARYYSAVAIGRLEGMLGRTTGFP